MTTTTNKDALTIAITSTLDAFASRAHMDLWELFDAEQVDNLVNDAVDYVERGYEARLAFYTIEENDSLFRAPMRDRHWYGVNVMVWGYKSYTNDGWGGAESLYEYLGGEEYDAIGKGRAEIELYTADIGERRLLGLDTEDFFGIDYALCAKELANACGKFAGGYEREYIEAALREAWCLKNSFTSFDEGTFCYFLAMLRDEIGEEKFMEECFNCATLLMTYEQED